MNLGPSSSAAEVIAHLQTLRSQENIAGMARFGIVTDHALGISNTDLRAIARRIGRDHQRAALLWDSGIREARLLASYTVEPAKLTFEEMRERAAEFNSWEMVDAWADTFAAAGLGETVIPEFAADNREFVRRTAFAMLAWTAVHAQDLADEDLIAFLPLVETHATDGRNFVRKAVNWALRQIGKRSLACQEAALMLSERLAASPDKTARWVGKDAVRELRSPTALRQIERREARRTRTKPRVAAV